MNGKQLNKLLGLNAKHALYRDDGRWYHNLKLFPGVLFDKDGFIIFQSEEEYLGNRSLNRNKNLHIKDGIKSLNGYIYFSDLQKLYFKESITPQNQIEKIQRIRRYIEVIIRDQQLVDKIKSLYIDTCQLCGTRIKFSNNTYYSEVHHIHPLGMPHNEPDSMDNMICVCPNCHIRLDYKSIVLDKTKFWKINHYIAPEHIDYHNNFLQKKR